MENLSFYFIDDNYIKSSHGQISRRLSSSEIAILCALIDAEGRIVSRDDLMLVGWPGKVVVANSLNMAILSIRKALDTFGLDKNLVTVPRCGFKLNGSELFGKLQFSKDNNNEHDLTAEVVPPVRTTITYESSCSTLQESIAKKHIKNDFLFLKLTFSLIACILVLLGLFFNVERVLNKPTFQCSLIKNNIMLCSERITNSIRSAVQDDLKSRKCDNNSVCEVWGEVNLHTKCGYKFYYFGFSENEKR